MNGAKNERPGRRRFATVKEVADMLALPATNLYDRARAGKMPGVVKVGRRIIFDLDKLEAWLDAGGDFAEGGEQ